MSLGGGLVSSARAVKVTQSPPGLSGFTLAKGASRTFRFTVKGVSAGSATLRAAASGRSASSGKAVNGAGQATVKVKDDGPDGIDCADA